MKKFIIYSLALTLVVVIFFKFFFDPIVKSIVLKRLTADISREISIQEFDTNFLKRYIQIKNIQIKNNKIFTRENLAEI